jgi:hypothetical protein
MQKMKNTFKSMITFLLKTQKILISMSEYKMALTIIKNLILLLYIVEESTATLARVRVQEGDRISDVRHRIRNRTYLSKLFTFMVNRTRSLNVKNRPKICGSNVRKAMSKRNKMTYKLV